MHVNGIGIMNTISRHIKFATGSKIKIRKVDNIEYGIKYANKIYLQRGLKTTHINADSEFEPLCEEMADLGISLN